MKRKTSDTRITPDKVQALSDNLGGIIGSINWLMEDLKQIKIEVEVLRDANIAMSKTIKKARYKE